MTKGNARGARSGGDTAETPAGWRAAMDEAIAAWRRDIDADLDEALIGWREAMDAEVVRWREDIADVLGGWRGDIGRDLDETLRVWRESFDVAMGRVSGGGEDDGDQGYDAAD